MADTSPAALSIRPVEAPDFETWRPLWDGYQHFYGRAATDDLTRLTWQRFLDPHEPMHALLAVDGQRVLGLVQYIFHRNTWMAAPVCYLQDLFTTPEARGRGIGRRLIEAVYAAAKAAGSPRVYWLTHESNEAAIQLYDKIAERPGFIQFRKTLDPF